MVKRVLVEVALSALLAAGGGAAFLYGVLPHARPAPAVTAPTDPERIAHGRYLANHVAVCLGCHSETDTTVPGQPARAGRLGSGRVLGGPELGFPGTIVAPNLTSDVETGIGAWTDGEVLRAMREGVSRDGRPLFAMMPYQTYAELLSDDDALDIIGYLRTLEPIRHDPGRTQLDFPVNLIARTSPSPLYASAPPAPSEGVDRGNWLLRMGACADCHDTFDEQRQPVEGFHLAGGAAFPIPGKGVVYARNITSDPEDGIGSMTDEQVRVALTQGIGKDGLILYEMPWVWYAGQTAEDQRALVQALRAVPAVAHVVPGDTVAKPQAVADEP